MSECNTPVGSWVSGTERLAAQQRRWHYPELPAERLQEGCAWAPADHDEAERDLLCDPGCFKEGRCPQSRAFHAIYSPEKLPLRSAHELLGERTYSFVGDSIVRQQFLSLACQLRRHVDVSGVRPEHRYWRTSHINSFISLPLLPHRRGSARAGGLHEGSGTAPKAGGRARLQSQYLTGYFEGSRHGALPIDPRIFEVRNQPLHSPTSDA